MSKYSENLPPSLKNAIGWMVDYIQPGATFLDFGCSTGYFGNLIKQAKKAKVYGVEISEDVAEARKVLDGVYSFDLDGDWPTDIFKRQYDYAFFGDVLEHLKHPDRALKNTMRLLKPDGKLFVSIPNIAHMSARLELLGGNFEYESMGIFDSTHLKYFTLKSFTDLAKRSGYKVEAVDYSLNDYPKEVISKTLKKLGLSPSPEFWKIADSTEARVFQYKFVLSPAGSSKTKPARALPKKPEQERQAFTDDLHQQIKNLRAHAEEQAKIIAHLEAQNASHASKVHKAAKKIKRIIKR